MNDKERAKIARSIYKRIMYWEFPSVREATIKRAIQWGIDNPEKRKFNKYKSQHSIQGKIGIERRRQRWIKRNPIKWKAIRASLNRRRKAKISSNVSNKILITQIYTKAQELRNKGFNVVVDHIVPIAKGGKHEPSNLQIIDSRENILKGVQTNFVPSVIY